MEFENDYFENLSKKKPLAIRNANYMSMLSKELKGSDRRLSDTLFMRAERIKSCLTFWKWGLYNNKKVLELLDVSRCKDMWCPNCRLTNTFKAVNKLSGYTGIMFNSGYTPYLLTLTNPNVLRKDLSSEIDKINKAFSKFWKWLYKPYEINGIRYGGYKERLFDAMAAIKVIEVTLQKSDWNYFHVHIHAIVFLTYDTPFDFEKNIPGGYQHKSESEIYFSAADILIQMLWKLAYNGKEITEIKTMYDDNEQNYSCDIRPLILPSGIPEVFKYCFKDFDVKSYEIFKDLFFGLYKKKLRQSYGEYYNTNIKNDFDKYNFADIRLHSELKEEEPEIVYLNNMKDITSKYGDYKKISIFKKIG